MFMSHPCVEAREDARIRRNAIYDSLEFLCSTCAARRDSCNNTYLPAGDSVQELSFVTYKF